jgi:tetratricopeptide (TPR) repeat protein
VRIDERIHDPPDWHNARMTDDPAAGAVDRDRRNQALAEAIRLREDGQLEPARSQLLALGTDWPDDAEIAYQTAWVHDRLGLEVDAVPFYEHALASGLAPEHRVGAYVGLGSTYRVLGRYEEARSTLQRGLAEFPGNAAMRTFLAMTHYNLGAAHDGLSLALTVLAETSADPDVQRYRPAIEYYAGHLDVVDEG